VLHFTHQDSLSFKFLNNWWERSQPPFLYWFYFPQLHKPTDFSLLDYGVMFKFLLHWEIWTSLTDRRRRRKPIWQLSGSVLFAMLFRTTSSLVGHENTRRWMICCYKGLQVWIFFLYCNLLPTARWLLSLLCWINWPVCVDSAICTAVMQCLDIALTVV